MAKNFIELSGHSKNSSDICIIGNKIEDNDDIEYLRNE
jgi:hypothetical protein